MHLRDWLYFKWQGVRDRLGLPVPQYTAPFLAPLESVQGDTEMERLFLNHHGRPVFKWADYLALYDRHFSPFRGRPITMLEIGVFKGGSLELWREYFGPGATLIGIDIDPECASRVDPPNLVRIGSQADPDFLRSVVAEIGPPDIILDDGSHIADHQMASFKTLYPLLKHGGLYVIEDLHTSYWPGEHAGGYRRTGTAIELVKQLIDDMHGWFHDEAGIASEADILGIHAYESLVFIEKGQKARPRRVETKPQRAC